MGIQAPAKVKFALIREASMQSNNLLNIEKLCEIAKVSRSGYYYWLAAEDKCQAREEADQRDFMLILKAYNYRGYDRGILF